MSNPSAPEHSSFASNEPIIVGHFLLMILAWIGEIVIGHTHLISTAQWSSLTSTVVPLATTVILSLSALIMRRYVSPWWKRAETELEKVGISPIMLNAIEGLVENALNNWVTKQNALSTSPVSTSALASAEATERPAHAG